MNDIICAIATAAGESAIGIVRLTGEGCVQLASTVFKAHSGKTLIEQPTRYMAYGHIVEGDKHYDEVMVVKYLAPYSYTREDMVEIFTHGSYLSTRQIQQLMIKQGALLAEAGEFTKRAFINGRIDLSQAEAVMDLISAKTKKGFSLALDQLEGGLTGLLNQVSEQMTDMMAQIEVVIDYPDEDVEVVTRQQIVNGLNAIKKQLLELSDSYDAGKIIKDGIRLVIIGRPNVGKSSLLNALLKDNRAIVTDIAGTTRDVIEEYANIRGIPIRLIDTAGIRETDDMIERLGVEKTKAHFNSADMALIVFNSSEQMTLEDEQVLDVIADKKVIVVINKVDLVSQLEIERIKAHLSQAPIVYTSVTTNSGIDQLESQIEQLILSGSVSVQASHMLTNNRHYQAIVRANEALASALSALQDDIPLDIVEVDIANAYSQLGEITGKTVGDDVIGRIFEKFCLGK